MKLQIAAHSVDGMFRSLDCTHTYWKNCPKAWQGSYKGKEKKCSIVLEAVADYNMFFGHASYGYCGTLNDINILNLSPLLERLVDGSFEKLEKEAGVVPYDINGETFNKVFVLVDGIYPKFSRFVKGITETIGDQEKNYTGWQEACRKDVERAFGVLKGVWQTLERPILLHNLQDIGARVQTCVILHNILVSDRVMGDINVIYDPAFNVAEVDTSADVECLAVQQPRDLKQVQQIHENMLLNDYMEIDEVAMEQLVTRGDRFKALDNKEEYEQLFQALKNRFGSRKYERTLSNSNGAAPI